METKRERANALYAQGLTYREIGHSIGLSRQRVQQIVRPPKAIFDLVKERAQSKCQGTNCGVVVAAGHVCGEDFSQVSKLKYLCPSCHQKQYKRKVKA